MDFHGIENYYFSSNIKVLLHLPDEFDEDVEADPMDEPEATDRSGMLSNLIYLKNCTG